MKSIKFFMRKFRFNKKKSFLLRFFVLVCLGVSVGYAFLTTTLNITGALNIAGSRWDVHFENVEEQEGSVTATTPPRYTNDTETSISFSTTLDNPGDFYEFTVDIVNDGTYDAKIDTLTLTPSLTTEEQEYFEYKIRYTEGGEVQVGDALDAGTTENITVTFQYKENEDDSKYPGEDIEFNLSVTMNYIQGIGNPVSHTTLYSVLQDAAIDGRYAKEYTGEHHDSFTKEPSKKIYHWYAPAIASGDSLGTEIFNKSNVVFGGFCWQMYRTTDTGGVKMIYNGIENDGKCNNTGENRQIGTSPFNESHLTSISDVGYMYKERYPSEKIRYLGDNSLFTKTSMSRTTSYYYGTDVVYDSSTNRYTLTGTSQDQWTNQYKTAAGLYTCRNTTGSACSTVYYIVGGLSSSMYGFAMTDGHLIDYYNTDFVLGTNYTENEGMYTLQNVTTIKLSDWYTDYANYKKYYTCANSATSCSDMIYTFSTTSTGYSFLELNHNYIYANSFTYDPSTSTYILDTTNRVQFWDLSDTDNQNLLNNNHYTCFNTTGKCSTISYLYYGYYRISLELNYINLTNGKSMEDAINEMLFDDNVNTISSTIKTYIEDWYENNLLPYGQYLEDTIFCNGRDITQLGAFDPNGGKLSAGIFKYHSWDDDLKCVKDTDSFSISNRKAKLQYPIGLLTYPEADNLGNANILFSEEDYWMISAMYYSDANAAIHFYSYSSYSGGGSFVSQTVSSSSSGVRPVISLKPGIEFTSGDGSIETPYIVKMND